MSVTSQPESQTRDYCRMPMSEIQFPRSPLTDLQGTTNNHCSFENLTQLREYDYTNYNYLKIENPIEISREFRLKNGLIPLV